MRHFWSTLIILIAGLAVYVGSYALISWRGQVTMLFDAVDLELRRPVEQAEVVFFDYSANVTLDRALYTLYYPLYVVDRELITRRSYWNISGFR